MRKIRASKCEIRNVPTAEQREFLNKNHIQGYTPCSLCIGLYLNNELVYLQSYGKTRRSNIDYVDWDMKRMCGPKDAYVYGGASKLLKYFLENYDLGKGLVTYCDPESFDGHTYEKIGFTLHHVCADDYRYVKDGVEYNKQHGKKSVIWARLKKENPDIEPFDVWKTKHTEREMMEKLGYERVMHKGLIAYIISGKPKWYIYDIEINGYHYVGQHVYYKNLSEEEMRKDGYWGSGIRLPEFREMYHTNGSKTILCYNLKNKVAADTAEKAYIEASRKKYGRYEEGGKCLNKSDGGQFVNNSEFMLSFWNSEKGSQAKIKISEFQKTRPRSDKEIEHLKSIASHPNPHKGEQVWTESDKKRMSKIRKEYYKTHTVYNKDLRTKEEIELRLSEMIKNKPKPILTGKPDADACILKMREVEDKINADGLFTRKQLYSVISPGKFYRDYELVYKIGQTGAFRHK